MTRRSVTWLARWLAAIALAALPAVTVGTTATAAPKICVALVVDFGDLGGGVHTTCASVAKGSTGYDVLRAGGHTFAICSNGVLGSIDGRPANGCTQMKDNKHYWSYWHRARGSTRWTYSNLGAGGYHPANASTEGWRWMDTPPANVPYNRICKTATPSPTSSPPRSSPRAPVTASPTAARRHRGTATSGPTTAIAASSQARRHASTNSSSAGAQSTKAPTPSAQSARSSAVAASPAVTPTPSTAPSAVADDSHRPASAVGPGVVAGVAVALALAAGAGWQLHRRRSNE
jgi:hypothetical protein